MLHARPKSSRKPHSKPVVSLVGWSEAHKRSTRARSEADLITSALSGTAPLDRDAMGAEQFPFNDIASSDRVIAAVEKLVRTRLSGSPWMSAHKALLNTDENGNGYAEFVVAFRDAAFQVGVDYALRSAPRDLPDWWPVYQRLDARTKAAMSHVVQQAAKAGDQ
jgi:hypothetical protein